eukprot:8681007-Pyramimonas_sp.AAC.1
MLVHALCAVTHCFDVDKFLRAQAVRWHISAPIGDGPRWLLAFFRVTRGRHRPATCCHASRIRAPDGACATEAGDVLKALDWPAAKDRAKAVSPDFQIAQHAVASVRQHWHRSFKVIEILGMGARGGSQLGFM